MAHQALDDVDVLSPAHEARGVGVPPAVWVVAAVHARSSPGLEDQVVQRPSSIATAEVTTATVSLYLTRRLQDCSSDGQTPTAESNRTGPPSSPLRPDPTADT